MGRFAIMPKKRLALGLACPKAKLWAISWMAGMKGMIKSCKTIDDHFETAFALPKLSE